MKGYFLRRMLLMIPTMLGVTILVFTMMQFVPGGPLERALAQAQAMAQEASGGGAGMESEASVQAETLEALREQFGFYKPILFNLNVLDMRRNAEYVFEVRAQSFESIGMDLLRERFVELKKDTPVGIIDSYISKVDAIDAPESIENSFLNRMNAIVRDSADRAPDLPKLYAPIRSVLESRKELRSLKFRCDRIAMRMGRRLIPFLVPIALETDPGKDLDILLFLLSEYADLDEAESKDTLATWWQDNESEFSPEKIEEAIDGYMKADGRREMRSARQRLDFFGGLASYAIWNRIEVEEKYTQLSKYLDAWAQTAGIDSLPWYEADKADEIENALDEAKRQWANVEMEYRVIGQWERTWKIFADSRYGNYMINLAQLDFGISDKYQEPVWDLFKQRFPISIQFGLIGFILAYTICIPLGILKAVYHRSTFDFLSSALVFAAYSVPGWAVGVVLIILLGGGTFPSMSFFPIDGIQSADASSYGNWEWFLDRVHHMVLPVTAYVAGSFATLTVLMKNSLMENLGQDYVRTAFAKGLSEKRVIFMHAVRNSLIPIATGLGHIFSIVIAGSYLIEYVFSINGFGLLGVKSVMDRDYMVSMALVIVTAGLRMFGNIFSDFLYCVIDPRIRFQ